MAMTANDVLTKAVTRGIPGASVNVTMAAGKYEMTVKSAKFANLTRGDREAFVYNTLAFVPVELLAKIATIECQT